MSSLSRELVFFILQILDGKEKFKKTMHELEQESGFFFNMKYLEDQVHCGEWEEVERYLSGFTKVDDNSYSRKIFKVVGLLKYLEALDKQDHVKAADILVKDKKVLEWPSDQDFNEITQLLTSDDFRENEQFSWYRDSESPRKVALAVLKKMILANPLFRDKLTFPAMKASRLRTLVNELEQAAPTLQKNPSEPGHQDRALKLINLVLPWIEPVDYCTAGQQSD